MKKIKIIATIGPGSNNPEILEKLRDRGVDFFRINLSHTGEEEIEQRIKDLIGYGVPIIVDTEGPQIRSGNHNEIHFQEGDIVKLFENKVQCNSQNLFLNPGEVVKKLEDGDLISIDFNSMLLTVFDSTSKNKGFVLCKVVIGGSIGGKKAVQIQNPTFNLAPFSKKDNLAIELAKKYAIKHFTLSFMEAPENVIEFKQKYPQAIVYSKIESKEGLKNFQEIAKVSDGILIDRGDLSNQVPLEKIPFIQKAILNKVRNMGKEAIVATNTLEQMAFALKPSKAEVNDIINTFLDGATAIALTKETAVGKYPVETVNTLVNLINQFEFLTDDKEDLLTKIEKTNYLNSEDYPQSIIKPHGGVLVNKFDPAYNGKIPKKSIEIDEETLMDLEQIAIGTFSPIEGFMGKNDLISVAEKMKLQNGIIWPLPIVLSVNEEIKKDLVEKEDVALIHKWVVYGILHLNEIYSVDKEKISEQVYGTKDKTHPGVKKFLERGDYFLGGEITLLKRRESPNKFYELTPKQTRKIFTERGWNKIVGFHTRNVIHKCHEFIQMEALKKSLCDGLFVHPIIGKKKPGDFEAEVIIKTYEKMIESFYPKSKVIMGAFATYSRYGGPRESIFTALCRKNFGCSHFIVGRDHTGVGSFYDPLESHKIFDRFTKEELGITPIKFGNIFYSDVEKKHMHEPEFMNYPEEHKMNISGTQSREMLLNGVPPPDWFMRPEISQIVIDKIKNGERVFVE